MGCNTQLLIGLVQEDSRCLIAPAWVIAMATPVDQQHNSLRVERGEHPSCDCCNIAGGQEIQHLRQHDQIEAAVGPLEPPEMFGIVRDSHGTRKVSHG
jgi:hypothetical protein